MPSDGGHDDSVAVKQAPNSGTKPRKPRSRVAVPRTTVMMRNLPNDYKRDVIVELIESKGFKGCFDLVYLPIDFERGAGLGYAFVNFVDTEAAERFLKCFSGFKNWAVTTGKVCEVMWSGLQGLKAHVERYRNSPVMHESIPDEFRPALFKDSQRIPFPQPTKKIRAPRQWHRK